ncbi:MAG: Sin3 associated polypeptide p18-domain-containing protein, partial [Podila humilis]
MSTEVTKDSVIDREKQCPFLLRIFYGPGEKPREREISSSEAPELDIYTWKDATLGEISLAIKKAIPDMIVQAGPGCLLEFRHMTIEADRSGYTGRDIGTVRLDQVSSISGTGSAPDQEGISTQDIHNNSASRDNRRNDRNIKSDRPNKSYEKTLQTIRHEPGDFLTVAVASARPGFISANMRFSLENPPGRSSGRGGSDRDGGRRGDRDGAIRNGRSGGGRRHD